MRPVLAALAALAAGALVGGCGFDVSQDDDVEPDPATVRSGLATLWAGPEPTPELADEGACFADGLTDAVPLDDLVEAGVVNDDGTVGPDVPMLDVDTAGAWVDAAAACTPYAAIAGRTLAARFAGRLDGDGYTRCLDATLPVERQREALVDALTGRYGSSPAVDELEAAVVTCAQQSLETG